MVRLLLFFVMLSTVLGACGDDNIQVFEKPVLTAAHVPAEIRTCADIPTAPLGATLQSEVAVYVVDLHATATDCKAKLKAVDAVLKRHDATLLAEKQKAAPTRR